MKDVRWNVTLNVTLNFIILMMLARVPEQLQRAMAAEAEAAREARAKVIAAEGEHKASRSLRLAAEVITDSPAALQVRDCFSRYFTLRNCLTGSVESFSKVNC